MDEGRLRVLFDAERIRLRVEALARELAADFPDRPGAPPLWLIGALKGAMFLLADLARAMPRPVSLDFVRTRSYGSGTASSGNVHIDAMVGEEVRGADVVLVEDIVDSGRTAVRLSEALRSLGPRTCRVATLLDKPSRRAIDFQPDYVGFEVPDYFVVGYGMDYGERYRHLPAVYVFDPPREE